MKILSIASNFATVYIGQLPIDIFGAEGRIECNDGSTLYVSLCWISNAPEEMSHYISKEPLLDFLVDEDLSDTLPNEMEVVSYTEYTNEQLSDEEFADILNNVRGALYMTFQIEPRYKGMFKEDAFVGEWNYYKAIEKNDSTMSSDKDKGDIWDYYMSEGFYGDWEDCESVEYDEDQYRDDDDYLDEMRERELY